MQLSSEQFERIVGMAAPADAPPAAGDVVAPAGSRQQDRRTATRIPFGARAKIIYENPEQDGLTDTVMLQDISVQGVGFVSAEWIALDEILVVHLKDQNNKEVPIRCKVQRCEPGGYGGVSYIVGTRFQEILDKSPAQSAETGATPKKAARKRRPAGPSGGLLKKLNPLRFFGRNFDDFSTVTSEGSKLARSDEEEEEEKPGEMPMPAAIPASTAEGAPAQRPRKSSIFLREDSKPVAAVEERVQEPAAVVAVTARGEEPAAETVAADENAESQSISADDIAAILNAIPAEKPAGGQEPEDEIAAVLESVELEEVIEPATSAVAEVPAAAIAMVMPEAVKIIEAAIPEPVATAPAVIVEPAPVVAVEPEPVKAEAKVSEPVVIAVPPVVIAEPAPLATVKPESVVATAMTPEPAPVVIAGVVKIEAPTPVVVVEPAPVAAVNVEPEAIKSPMPEPVALVPAPVVAKQEAARIEPTIPAPVVVAAAPALIVEPAPVVAVKSEPVAIKSSMPEPVAVAPAPAVFAEPAPVVTVKPEPVVIKSSTPEAVAAVSMPVVKPEPVKIEPAVVAEPAAVIVEKSETVKIEPTIAEPVAVVVGPVAIVEAAPVVVEKAEAVVKTEPTIQEPEAIAAAAIAEPAPLVQPEPVQIETTAGGPVAAVQAVAAAAPVEPEPAKVEEATASPQVAAPAPVSAQVAAAPSIFSFLSSTQPVAAQPKISPQPAVVRERPVSVPTPAIKSSRSERAGAGDLRKTRFKFTAETLPTYFAAPATLDELIPWLSFQGVRAGELPAALIHLGFDGSGASAMNVSKLKDAWAEEYRAWCKRDLHGKRFVYMWADGVKLGQTGMLIVTGATEKGERELVSLMPGERESEQSWSELLTDLKNRGLIRPPKIFVGDAKLGLWKPLRAMSVAIRQQHCWTHKTAELRAGFPPNMQARIEAKMQEIFMAPRRDEAIGPFDLFVRNSPKEAGACLAADKETLLTFHDFPVEHWPYLRNTNSITSIFDTIDLSAYSADGAIGIEQGIILAFKLAQSAQKHWRKLSASPLLADVLKGTAFIDGVKAAA